MKRSKRKIHPGGNSKYTKYSVTRSGRYKWYMEQNQKRNKW